MKDSVIDHAHVISQAFSIEELPEEGLYNQVSSNDMYAFFQNGEIHEAQAVDNVLVAYYPVNESDSTYEGLVRMETTKMRLMMEHKKLTSIWTPKASGMMYPMSQIPPDKKFLERFHWFDYVRPLSKDDIFVWRPKKAGTEMKPQRHSSGGKSRKKEEKLRVDEGNSLKSQAEEPSAEMGEMKKEEEHE
jgi:hypothetical protein